MFKEKVKINFYDCDPAGILFYANLFKFAHKVYEALIESFNLEAGYFNNQEFVVPIIHAEGDYFVPMKPGDNIDVSVYVSQLKKSSFELTYNFLSEELILCASVKTVHVFVNKSTFKKTEIPSKVLGKLKALKE